MHWFGVTHLEDSHGDSFPSAIGSNRDSIVRHLQDENLGKLYKGIWKLNQDSFSSYIYNTLNLSRTEYDITSAALPGDGTKYIYIAKRPKQSFAGQQKDVGTSPPTRPLTDSSRTERDAQELSSLTADSTKPTKMPYTTEQSQARQINQISHLTSPSI